MTAIRASFVLMLFAAISRGQWVSVGLTGAVPVSPHSGPVSSQSIPVVPTDGSPGYQLSDVNDFYQKPYAVGPTVEFYLPGHFSLVAGMVYERFHRDMISGLSIPRGGGVNFGFAASTGANAFAFPLLARYTLPRGGMRPFVDAGATLRHLGVFEGSGNQLDFNLHPIPSTFRFDPNKPIDVAITAGVGLRRCIAGLEVIPELRFFHWTATYEQPVQNQAMFVLTLALPHRLR